MTKATTSRRAPVRYKAFAIAVVSGGLVLFLAGCSARPGPAEPSDTAAAPDPVHWAYEGDEGPDRWGELSADFTTCSTGTAQSPIDLPAQLPANPAMAIHLDLGTLPTVGEVLDTGHSHQFVSKTNGTEVDVDSKHYELLQMHAHTPSEHTIDGVPAAAEFHFVHENADGALLVVGVLAEVGEPNAQWQPFIGSAAGAAKSETVMSFSGLFPADPSFYAYEGSLTTPPCTEGLQWIVLQAPITLSVEQVEQLSRAHDHNARPAAPLGNRIIEGGTVSE